MLEVHKLVKKFGDKPVVDGVSFAVPKGKLLALIGTSGCGKTTTLKMINRLIEPCSGRIEIDGKDVSKTDPFILRRKIGYVIQENGLFPHYTVAENIGIVPRLLGYPSERIAALIPEVLKKVELPTEGIEYKYPREISGGQQQRVAIARAIAANPPLLLMDEPFSALDPITRITARRNFKQFIRKLGISVVLVTHDVSEAIDLADIICLMDRGKVEQLGAGPDFLFAPASDYVRSFFQENRMETELKVVSLGDLVPLIESENTLAGDSKSILAEESLYDLTNQYSFNPDTCFRIVDPNQRTLAIARFNTILQAFHRFKTAYGKP